MTNLLTWNIQATKGCDERYDLARIVRVIREFGDLDVLCLQEVSRHIPDLNNDDQLSLLAQQFPEHQVVWAPGFSVPDERGRRCEFGNLSLVKTSLYRNSRTHILPGPRVSELQMPRTMVETVIAVGQQEVSVFNTHLAFHSEAEQLAQIQALTALRDQTMDKATLGRDAGAWGPYKYTDIVTGVILCGDLNVDSNGELFKQHVQEQSWVDCWTTQSRDHSGDRQPTCGIFDGAQWPQGPHVRDYFLATEALANRSVRVDVNVHTDASDHQPVFLELAL